MSGGAGHDEKGQEGEGAGFGAGARPVGAYVVKDAKVSGLPAVDVNRRIRTIGQGTRQDPGGRLSGR